MLMGWRPASLRVAELPRGDRSGWYLQLQLYYCDYNTSKWRVRGGGVSNPPLKKT